ncbi:uncharacterized protein [Diabrotica undecimpunctata]|uniref:uncharacterized protein n=1 Tax=Diabrotica undecimpunctata TaxID=50387 RepID=UPI003B63B153
MSSDNESVGENEVDGRAEEDSGSESVNNIEEERNEDETNVEDNQQNDTKKDDDETKKKEVKPKRKILNPIPKFDTQTIRNSKGLPAITGHFKDIKFKGKGYEEHDLNILMKTYEYWCHRFYPKFTFDDTIGRLEWLGNKKATQVYLRKIRMGLEDFLEEDNKIASDDEIDTKGFVEPNVDQFDKLLPEAAKEPEPTEEQLEIIRQNRLRAEAIRKERMSRMVMSSQVSSFQSQSENHSNEITEVHVEHEQELGLDNMLDMINEDDESTSVGISKGDEVKQKIFEERVSNAIKKNAVASDSEEEEENLSQNVSRTHKKNAPASSDSENHSSDHQTNMSDESAMLQTSLKAKKNKHNVHKIFDHNSQNLVEKKKKITVSDSDNDSNPKPSTSKDLFVSKQKVNSSQSQKSQMKKFVSSESENELNDSTSKTKHSFPRNRKKKNSKSNINKLSSDSESVKNSPRNNRKIISDEDSDDTSNNLSSQRSILKTKNPLHSSVGKSHISQKNGKKRTVLSDDSDISSQNSNGTDSDVESVINSQNSQINPKKRRILHENLDSSRDSLISELSDDNRKHVQIKKKKKILIDDTDSEVSQSSSKMNTEDSEFGSQRKSKKTIVLSDEDSHDVSHNPSTENSSSKENKYLNSDNHSQKNGTKTRLIISDDDLDDSDNVSSQKSDVHAICSQTNTKTTTVNDDNSNQTIDALSHNSNTNN